MDSSEHEVPKESPTKDSEPMSVPDDEEVMPQEELSAPVSYGLGTYIHDGEQPSEHPVLGLLMPGENVYNMGDPLVAAAVKACVQAGVLRVP